MNSPVKNTGVGSHALLQGIFLTQGLNQRLLHCSQILYPVSHLGSPDLSEQGLILQEVQNNNTVWAWG